MIDAAVLAHVFRGMIRSSWSPVVMAMQTSSPSILETPRLILRVFAPDDADALERLHGDATVMRFSIGGPKTREQITAFIRNSRESYQRIGYSQWAIVWKNTGQCIGECGIWLQQIDGVDAHELSYRLRRDFWNRGIATEAALACRLYVFDKLDLDRVISIIDPRNAASIRVAEKVGMRREKDALFHEIPVAIYSLRRG
jgi:ribosomal-protein-alanine N-acetyltransferase